MISIITFLFSIKASISLSFKENKKIFLINYIVYLSFIILCFIFNYFYHKWYKGMYIDIYYILFINIFLIFMIVYNHRYLNKKYKFLNKFKENEITNDVVIGVNKNNIYNLKDIKKIKLLNNLFYFIFVFNLDLIALLILLNKINSLDIFFYLWIGIIIILSIIILILFIYYNHKIKLFNYKYYIVLILYILFMSSYYVISSLIIINNFDFNNSLLVLPFFAGLLLTGTFFSIMFKVIYPYYELFFRMKIKELENK